MDDTRNLIDEFKGKTETDIITSLDGNGVTLEVAIENVERDFNMGSIVRTANAFGVRRVHVIGRRQWNKRGAMATDKYLHMAYYGSVAEFRRSMDEKSKCLVAVDNVPGAIEITQLQFPDNVVMIFGSESSGISSGLLDASDHTVFIKQSGSTRSMNVAAAAAVAMYEWSRRRSVID